MVAEVVEFRKPDGAEELEEQLRELADLAARGELVSVYFIGIKADGFWCTGTRGKIQSVREIVGGLEALKLDILTAASEGQP